MSDSPVDSAAAGGDAEICSGAEGGDEQPGDVQPNDDGHTAEIHTGTIEHTDTFEASIPNDVPLKHTWFSKTKTDSTVKGRGKVSLILSSLTPGPHVTSEASFINSCLKAVCVVEDRTSASEPANRICYRFERMFPPDAVIAHVTWKVKRGCMKIYFDKLTEFSLRNIWPQSS